MITKEQAMALKHGDEVWHVSHRNADKTPLRARVNGKCHIWVTRPAEFEVPMKHGLRNCFYITQDNAHEFVLPSEWEETMVNRALDGKPVVPFK